MLNNPEIFFMSWKDNLVSFKKNKNKTWISCDRGIIHTLRLTHTYMKIFESILPTKHNFMIK